MKPNNGKRLIETTPTLMVITARDNFLNKKGPHRVGSLGRMSLSWHLHLLIFFLFTVNRDSFVLGHVLRVVHARLFL